MSCFEIVLLIVPIILLCALCTWIEWIPDKDVVDETVPTAIRAALLQANQDESWRLK